jgi:fatty-acyl-CoA synthase
MDHVRLHLAGFKVPRHVWFVDSLERTPAGKLDYQRVRSMTEDLLADAYPADDGVAGA